MFSCCCMTSELDCISVLLDNLGIPFVLDRKSSYVSSRGLYSSNKLNCFPHEYIWDEYPSTISILPYTWNNDVFRDKKGFWCIKITNQIISLLKGYTNLVKEHSFLHLRLHVRPFMIILPHQIRICEYLSNRNPYLFWRI